MQELTKYTSKIQVGDKSDLELFQHQVAGHFNEVILSSHCGTRVYKPLIKPELFFRELKFYECVNKSSSGGDDSHAAETETETETKPSLEQFLAKYYGTYVDSSQNTDVDLSNKFFLVLENLTSSYAMPCLCDLKIGIQTYAPTASIDKQLRRQKKYKHQSLLGFRISGMKVFDIQKGEYNNYDKFFGRSLTPENVISDGLAKYFNNGISYRKDALTEIIEELEALYEWIVKQTEFHFYCSSLLFIYEGQGSSCQDISDTAASHRNKKAIVRLIDFAHATVDESTVDTNFIYGIEKLIKHLYLLVEFVA